MKRETYDLMRYGVLLIFVLVIFGIEKFKQILLAAVNVIKTLIHSFNLISITFDNGNGILTVLFSHPIIYLIVGIIFYFLPIRGKIGKWFGKICYYLCSIPVSALLNFISAKLF